MDTPRGGGCTTLSVASIEPFSSEETLFFCGLAQFQLAIKPGRLNVKRAITVGRSRAQSYRYWISLALACLTAVAV